MKLNSSIQDLHCFCFKSCNNCVDTCEYMHTNELIERTWKHNLMMTLQDLSSSVYRANLWYITKLQWRIRIVWKRRVKQSDLAFPITFSFLFLFKKSSWLYWKTWTKRLSKILPVTRDQKVAREKEWKIASFNMDVREERKGHISKEWRGTSMF